MMTSQVLRLIERRRLVGRVAHPTDTRARQLAMTDEGAELAQPPDAWPVLAIAHPVGIARPHLATTRPIPAYAAPTVILRA